MKTTLLLLALLSLPVFAGELPADAAALKGKRDAKITEINQLYANELEKLQKVALKNGSLEAANAIEKEIATVAVNPLKESDAVMKTRIAGSRWRNTSNGWLIVFRDDGKITKSWGKLTPDWTAKNGDIVVEGSVFKPGKDKSQMVASGGDKDGAWIKVD
jgi:hypothetical protein